MPQTSITLPFGDGRYTFRLGLKQINEIQNRCDAGIGAIFARVVKGRFFTMGPEGGVAVGDPQQAEYRVEDLLAVIRQGLLGGAAGWVDGEEVRVDAARADQLIENYVLGDSAPLKDAWALAAAILSVTIEGYDPPEADVGASKKKDGAETGASTTAKP